MVFIDDSIINVIDEILALKTEPDDILLVKFAEGTPPEEMHFWYDVFGQFVQSDEWTGAKHALLLPYNVRVGVLGKQDILSFLEEMKAVLRGG
jgi:hypothetical protein